MTLILLYSNSAGMLSLNESTNEWIYSRMYLLYLYLPPSRFRSIAACISPTLSRHIRQHLRQKKLHRNMEFNRIPQRSFKSIDCSFYPTEQSPFNKQGQLVVS